MASNMFHFWYSKTRPIFQSFYWYLLSYIKLSFLIWMCKASWYLPISLLSFHSITTLHPPYSSSLTSLSLVLKHLSCYLYCLEHPSHLSIFFRSFLKAPHTLFVWSLFVHLGHVQTSVAVRHVVPWTRLQHIQAFPTLLPCWGGWPWDILG